MAYVFMGAKVSSLRNLVTNAHFQVWQTSHPRVLRVYRTYQPFATGEEMRTSFREVIATLDSIGREGRLLLLDTRDSPPRNEEAFEREFGELRRRVLHGFREVACVMASEVGRLHAKRLGEEDGIPMAVFTSEAEATDYLLERIDDEA